MNALLLVAALLAQTRDSAKSPVDSRSEYEAMRRTAARTADAQVKLALWCEQHGLTVERAEHLSIALLSDPNHALARALLGQIRTPEGRWKRVEPGEIPAADAVHTEYTERRARMKNTADAHWDLAMWCKAKGLDQEARAHLMRVTRLDPKRDAAWKHLGYKKSSGRWMTPEQIATAEAERKTQRQATEYWVRALRDLKSKNAKADTRTDAETQQAAITDPRAVPAIWRVYAVGTSANHTQAVQLLGQIDSGDASRALAWIAVASPSEIARRLAGETLRRRDPREFADVLISAIRTPIRYQVQPVGGPGSPGVLQIASDENGRRVNYNRVFTPPPLPELPYIPPDRLVYDFQGLPVAIASYDYQVRIDGDDRRYYTPARYDQLAPAIGGPSSAAVIDKRLGELHSQGVQPTAYDLSQAIIEVGTKYVQSRREEIQIPVGRMIVETQRAAAMAQEQLEAEVAKIESYNTEVNQANNWTVGLLTEISGVDLGTDRRAWTKWHVDQLGFRADLQQQDAGSTPIEFVQFVSLAYQPIVPILNYDYLVSEKLERYTATARIGRFSCFGAGTPVHTRDGLKPIEQIKIGDRVLSFDPARGGLTYEPVLGVHHNPPSVTFTMNAAGDTIVTSEYHRFWVASRGWSMARDLHDGDPLRTMSGLTSVEHLEKGQVLPVFNLDVAGGHTFFVGKAGLLVHDNTLPDLRERAFDNLTRARAE